MRMSIHTTTLMPTHMSMLATTTAIATVIATVPTWVSPVSCSTSPETPSTVSQTSLISQSKEIDTHTSDLGVVIAALFMWLAPWESRFYADPGVSVLIGIIIFAGSLPLSE